MRYAPSGMLGVLAAAVLLLEPLGPAPARACPAAGQYRLIPLGATENQLVLLQMKQGRFADQAPWLEHMKWSIDAWLRFTDARGRLTSKRIDIPGLREVRDAHYTTDIRPILQRAMAKARTLKGFRPFGRPELTWCIGNTSRCGAWSTTLTRSRLFWLVHRPRGQRARFVSVENIDWYAQSMRATDGSDTDAASYRRTEQSITIYYVLSHRWGNRTVRVLNISSSYGGATLEKTWRPSRCTSVTTCVPPEPVGDHSLGMDVLLVDDPAQQREAQAQSVLPKPRDPLIDD